jgi:hypothetical protein
MAEKLRTSLLLEPYCASAIDRNRLNLAAPKFAPTRKCRVISIGLPAALLAPPPRGAVEPQGGNDRIAWKTYRHIVLCVQRRPEARPD